MKHLKSFFTQHSIRILQIAVCCAVGIGSLHAQDDSRNILKEFLKNNDPHTVYTYAENYYSQGYFDTALALLSNVHKVSDTTVRSSMYRLIALCHIEQGRIDDAHKDVASLINTDPYYSPSASDNAIFLDLIQQFKSKSTATISTASQQAESIGDAPVPVTLITEEMILHSGCTTLQELLCLYVPGMSLAEGIESNIAMHGIYGLSQENILFLQDGHRLNGASTNAEAPDFRNSLDKIQQIEVLRGPSSSLYGNVALTAVVNIITKCGSNVNGGKLRATFGTQDTYGGSFLAGGGNNVADVIAWGDVERTEGFRHEVENNTGGTTTLYAHGANRRPSYDMGVKGHWRNFSVTINSQRSKQTPYVNMLQFPANMKSEIDLQTLDFKVLTPTPNYDSFRNFNHDSYSNIGSNGPGITRTNHHMNLDYAHTFGNVDFMASAYVSLEHTSFYNVMGDSIDTGMGSLLLLAMVNSLGQLSRYQDAQSLVSLLSMVKTKGVFQLLEWENISFGGQAQAQTDYRLLGRGSVTLGIQYDHFALTNGVLFLGGNYSAAQMTSGGGVFADGQEDAYSGYAQLKHYLSDKFIINAGLRYDHKVRFSGNRLNRLSPRLSFVFKPGENLSARLCYNYSFVDAPYIYRACRISMFSGGEDMKPETMKSFQGGLMFQKQECHFSAEASASYNILNDIVTQNADMKTTEYMFGNSGNIRQLCVDGSFQYSTEKIFTNVNATWQRFLRSEGYPAYDHNAFGIPHLMANATAAVRVYNGRSKGFFSGGTLWLRGNLHLQSRSYYQTTDAIMTFLEGDLVSNVVEVKPQAVLSVGAGYTWKMLTLDLGLRNLTNNQFMVGSLLSTGVPRAGRQLLGKLIVRF